MTAAACQSGEVLAQKLEALGVIPTELTRQLHVPANRINQIVNGKHAVTGETPDEASAREGCLMLGKSAAEVAGA